MINLAMLVAACYISTSLKEVLDELSYSDQHLYRITSLMVPLFSFAIVTQIVSLPVMLKKPKTGFTLASIGSFVMLPLSMFFISCCLASSENHRNKSLNKPHQKDVSELDSKLTFDFGSAAMSGLFLLIGGVAAVFIGLSVGGLLLLLSIFSFYKAFRLNNRIMIGMQHDKLIITPSPYFDTYILPVSDVSLIKDNNKLFQLHIESTDVDRVCSYSKRMIEEDQYQDILNDIFSKLAK